MDGLIVSVIVALAGFMVGHRVWRFLKGRVKCDECTHKCDLVEPPPLLSIEEPKRRDDEG